MTKTPLAALVLMTGIGLLETGCLQKNIVETWYLDSEGAVTWVVQESDVRSDESGALERQAEEGEYAAAVQRQDQPVARAFRELGFTGIRTRVLRPTVPLSVVTDANAGRIDQLGQALIARLGVQGTSVLERTGDIWDWAMTIADSGASDAAASDDMAALASGLDSLRVVLVSGRFEHADGFTLSGDGRVAECTAFAGADDDRQDTHGTIRLRLQWR